MAHSSNGPFGQSRSHPTWTPPSLPLLAPHAEDLHVWKFELDCEPAAVACLGQLLDETERQRADRFCFDRDRHCYTVCRGLLRLILGMYLNQSPTTLQFDYGPQGKPALAAIHSASIRFNLSHSHNLALFAFSDLREVGVDVEFIRSMADWHEIAERFFTSSEQAAMHRFPAEQRQAAFFHCWTRKEAYIKARGAGLSLPLDQFEVTLSANNPPRLLRVPGTSHSVSGWSLLAIDTHSNYAAALVVEGAEPNLQTWSTSIESLLATCQLQD